MKRRLLATCLLCLAAGCGTTTPPTKKAESPAAAVELQVPSGFKLVSFGVPGMQCPLGCPGSVKSALAEVAGVGQIDVNYETKTAKVVVDPTKFKVEDAIASLEKKGFPKSELKQ